MVGRGSAELVLQTDERCCPWRLFDDTPMTTKLQWYSPPRRRYSRRELLADRIINFVGAGLSWVGAPLLGFFSWYAGDDRMKQLGFWAHGVGLVTMLTCSALYHYWCWDWRFSRQLLSLDHVGISAMIMGTYTPPMIYCLCYRVLALVYVLGVGGLLMEAHQFVKRRKDEQVNSENSRNWGCVDVVHVIRYLVMGWSVALVIPSMRALPTMALFLMIAGGVIYTAGVVIFIKENIEFHLAIWHGMVLIASSCFYISNLLSLVGASGVGV